MFTLPGYTPTDVRLGYIAFNVRNMYGTKLGISKSPKDSALGVYPMQTLLVVTYALL